MKPKKSIMQPVGHQDQDEQFHQNRLLGLDAEIARLKSELCAAREVISRDRQVRGYLLPILSPLPQLERKRLREAGQHLDLGMSEETMLENEGASTATEKGVVRKRVRTSTSSTLLDDWMRQLADLLQYARENTQYYATEHTRKVNAVFANLYRSLQRAKEEDEVVPISRTLETHQCHWNLLSAENSAWVTYSAIRSLKSKLLQPRVQRRCEAAGSIVTHLERLANAMGSMSQQIGQLNRSRDRGLMSRSVNGFQRLAQNTLQDVLDIWETIVHPGRQSKHWFKWMLDGCMLQVDWRAEPVYHTQFVSETADSLARAVELLYPLWSSVRSLRDRHGEQLLMVLEVTREARHYVETMTNIQRTYVKRARVDAALEQRMRQDPEFQRKRLESIAQRREEERVSRECTPRHIWIDETPIIQRDLRESLGLSDEELDQWMTPPHIGSALELNLKQLRGE